MKKLLLLLFPLFFLSSPPVLAKDLVYHCNLETYYTNDGNEWFNKKIRYTFTFSNNSVSIYDHEIDLTYNRQLSIYSQSPNLIAIGQFTDLLETLVIDKKSSNATLSYSYTDYSISGSYGIGPCKLQ